MKQTCSNCKNHDWESNNHRLDHYCLDFRPEFKEWKINETNDYSCWVPKSK